MSSLALSETPGSSSSFARKNGARFMRRGTGGGAAGVTCGMDAGISFVPGGDTPAVQKRSIGGIWRFL